MRERHTEQKSIFLEHKCDECCYECESQNMIVIENAIWCSDCGFHYFIISDDTNHQIENESDSDQLFT